MVKHRFLVCKHFSCQILTRGLGRIFKFRWSSYFLLFRCGWLGTGRVFAYMIRHEKYNITLVLYFF